MSEDSVSSKRLGFLSLDGYLFESIAVYFLGGEVLADFLGIKCKKTECVGYIYYPSRVHRRIMEMPIREIEGFVIFTNDPKDILSFFIYKEKALMRTDSCYITNHSFVSLKYNGVLDLIDEEKATIKLVLGEVCDLRLENCLPMNRFTNALLEVLINLTKIRYFSEKNEIKRAEKLLEINEHFIELLVRHSSESPELSYIKEKVLDIIQKQSYR